MPAAKTDPEPSSRSTFSKIGFRTTQINLYEREINIRKMGIGDVCCYIFMLSTKVRSLGRIFEIVYSQSGSLCYFQCIRRLLRIVPGLSLVFSGIRVYEPIL